jgi:hypothetical protein
MGAADGPYLRSFAVTLRPVCGSEMRIIAFVTDRSAIHSILRYLREPTAAPEVAPARGPPLWEQAAQSHWDETPAPAPEYVFDQRVSW